MCYEHSMGIKIVLGDVDNFNNNIYLPALFMAVPYSAIGLNLHA